MNRSVLVAAAGVLFAVVVLLGGVFLLGRSRPSGGVEPVPTVLVAAAPTLAATAAPTLVPTFAPTAIPTSAPTTAPAAALAPTPQIGVAAPALKLQMEPTPEPTPYGWWDRQNQFPADLDTEVRAAYDYYWQERVDAAFNLDPALLQQVEADKWLAGETAALDTLRDAGKAQKAVANHSFKVRYATDSEALVLDDYTVHLETVDASTKATLVDEGSKDFHSITRMAKVDGIWKAVDQVQVTRS